MAMGYTYEGTCKYILSLHRKNFNLSENNIFH